MKAAKRSRGGGLPRIVRDGGTARLVVDGRPFVMLGGEVHNSSTSSVAYLREVWAKTARLHCNTVIAPVCWELVEPVEGRFDWTLPDAMVAESRRHGLRLVPLWFGTWKNASSDYAPAWVKTDPARFPRAEVEPGKRANTVSALSEEACAADACGFAAFMRRLKAVDAGRHTVIAVQVENETGLLGAARDRSPAAERAFGGPVPEALAARLASGVPLVRPELREPWQAAGARTAGTWSEVFGAVAEEAFMAWHTARFVNRVAEAGRKEYPLPMYANAWLAGGPHSNPGQYPSGGPVSRMLDIWRAAAPALECLAPDIYLEDFAGICADYCLGGNPLLVPEARKGAEAAANAFYAVAEHGALCFAPFAIEDVPPDGALAGAYALLAELSPLLAAPRPAGAIRGILKRKPVTEEEIQEVRLGDLVLRVVFPWRPEGSPVPGGLVCLDSEDGLVAAGSGFWFSLQNPGPGRPRPDFLWIEDGRFRKGKWHPSRRLNGDERYAALGTAHTGDPAIIRAGIYRY